MGNMPIIIIRTIPITMGTVAIMYSRISYNFPNLRKKRENLEYFPYFSFRVYYII